MPFDLFNSFPAVIMGFQERPRVWSSSRIPIFFSCFMIAVLLQLVASVLSIRSFSLNSDRVMRINSSQVLIFSICIFAIISFCFLLGHSLRNGSFPSFLRVIVLCKFLFLFISNSFLLVTHLSDNFGSFFGFSSLFYLFSLIFWLVSQRNLISNRIISRNSIPLSENQSLLAPISPVEEAISIDNSLLLPTYEEAMMFFKFPITPPPPYDRRTILGEFSDLSSHSPPPFYASRDNLNLQNGSLNIKNIFPHS